jgi:hypothetical protein
MSRFGRIGVLLIVFLMYTLPALARTEVRIFVGASGEPPFESRFYNWAERTKRALIEVFDIEGDGIQIVPRAAAAPPLTRPDMIAALESVGADLGKEDQLIVLLIGHGSDQREAKFMLDGADVTATALRAALDGIDVGSQLVVNTTSASGGFIAALGAPGRAVCTATRNRSERNATEFMEHLVRILEEGRGDADRNGRLSWGEWLNAGAADTLAWYEKEGYIATEHAVLDDNGDGTGSLLPLSVGKGDAGVDGGLATQEFLGADSRWQGDDHAAYATAIAAVEAWKGKKGEVDEVTYWSTLEQLLLKAAKLYPPPTSTD